MNPLSIIVCLLAAVVIGAVAGWLIRDSEETDSNK